MYLLTSGTPTFTNVLGGTTHDVGSVAALPHASTCMPFRRQGGPRRLTRLPGRVGTTRGLRRMHRIRVVGSSGSQAATRSLVILRRGRHSLTEDMRGSIHWWLGKGGCLLAPHTAYDLSQRVRHLRISQEEVGKRGGQNPLATAGPAGGRGPCPCQRPMVPRTFVSTRAVSLRVVVGKRRLLDQGDSGPPNAASNIRRLSPHENAGLSLPRAAPSYRLQKFSSDTPRDARTGSRD